MKPHRVIITRDSGGLCSVWPGNTVGLVLGQDGWDTDKGGDQVEVDFCARRFEEVFGFVPEKGVKDIYEIRKVTV